MKPRPYIGSAVLVLLLAGVIGCQSLEGSSENGAASRSGESGFGRVERVVDGDTVILSDGRAYRVATRRGRSPLGLRVINLNR